MNLNKKYHWKSVFTYHYFVIPEVAHAGIVDSHRCESHVRFPPVLGWHSFILYHQRVFVVSLKVDALLFAIDISVWSFSFSFVTFTCNMFFSEFLLCPEKCCELRYQSWLAKLRHKIMSKGSINLSRSSVFASSITMEDFLNQ